MKITRTCFKMILTILFFGLSVQVLAASKDSENSRLDSYNKLRKVIGTIENYYVDELTLDEIVNKAIEGLLSNLDAHSAYLDEKKFEELRIQTLH